MNGKPVFTVPVKTVLNLHSGFEKKLLCDGPTFSMGDACAYRCSFCYVPSMFQKLDRVSEILEQTKLAHDEVVIRRGNALEILHGQLVHPSGKRKFPDPNDRRVVYSSPSVDVAANAELCAETVAACRLILTGTNWQVRLLSKSNLLPMIARELGTFRDRVIYGVSTGTLDDKLARVFEYKTPLVSKRIESLHWLQDNGFRTFGMICPSLPLGSLTSYSDFAIDMYHAIRVDNCEHVWAEVLNTRGDSMTNTIASLREGGFEAEAVRLAEVAGDADAWELYARQTFLAHRDFIPAKKLRFLQYVNEKNRDWWTQYVGRGAVLL